MFTNEDCVLTVVMLRVKEEWESEWRKLRFTFIEGGSLCEIYAYIHTYTKEMYMSPSVSTFHKEIYSWYELPCRKTTSRWLQHARRAGWAKQWARPERGHSMHPDVPGVSLQNMFIAHSRGAYILYIYIDYTHANTCIHTFISFRFHSSHSRSCIQPTTTTLCQHPLRSQRSS